MGMLLLVFAIALGYATFVENDFSPVTARQIVYNSWWFEALMVLMVLNFAGMIFTKKLYRRSKWISLLIHLAWIIIILGAGITRYFGFEGKMHIRNGVTTNHIETSDTYIRVVAEGKNSTLDMNDKVLLAPLNKIQYDRKSMIDGKEMEVRVLRFIPNAVRSLRPDPEGGNVLDLVTAGPSGRQDLLIRQNETEETYGLKFSFGDTLGKDNIQLVLKGKQLFMRSPYPWIQTNMNAQDTTMLDSGVFIPAGIMKLYIVKNTLFVIRELAENVSIVYKPMKGEAAEGNNMVEMNVRLGSVNKDLVLNWQKEEQVNLSGINFSITAGEETWYLPFSLKLNRFQLDRYPGSESPSSFASEITLIDPKNKVTRPFRIFMNNVLKYRGYRFYQTSYDPDEGGTILSVNHDRLGTLVSYSGYFLLFVSLLISLFTRNNRFAKLSADLQELHQRRRKLAHLIPLFLILCGRAGTVKAQNIGENFEISRSHAAAFGKLLTQGHDGRISPVNTEANNVLVKIYKNSSYQGQSADQVFLGMIAFPDPWKEEPVIKVTDKHLKRQLGISGDFAAFNNFFTNDGKYLIQEAVNEAYQKAPDSRTSYDKELLAVDERINVCHLAFTGALLKIYPVLNHPSLAWAGIYELESGMQKTDSAFAGAEFTRYLQALRTAARSGDYSQADQVLEAIREIQLKYGGTLIPSPFKINLEVFYNHINIFRRLFPVYMMIGFLLLGLFMTELFRPSFEQNKLTLALTILLVIAFIVQTLGLAARWYIAGHAPWSNGYESMIYISWAIVLAGLLFRRTSLITLSATAILAGITLLTAHMSWLNPEITNLVPVLKSYWLTIHVATITASYGFLALGCMLGFLNLVLMIFRTKNNAERIGLTIDEISVIIEMALSVGLVLITMGTFLGGIWANESWGRYWGWDPKETWSLVTIIVYSFVLHMNLIPSFRTRFIFNFLSTIGFGSVLMTYFGVNYYLSGLHSYAQGDPVPVPSLLYYVLGFLFVLSLLAASSEYRFSKKPDS